MASEDRPEACHPIRPQDRAEWRRLDMAPTASEILALIDGGRFGTEYQPVLDLRTGAVLGHEALSRFFDEHDRAVSPGAVFARLHDNPRLLSYVEAATKRFQVEHAPAGALFLNVDPDSFRAEPDGAKSALFAAFGGHPRVVVEIIETMSTTDARLGHEVVHALRERSIGIALDDVGAPDALLSLDALKDADIVKFDCSWLERLSDRRDRVILETLLSLSRQLGAQTILEGVETTRDLDLATELGVDAVQGYLFRGQFRTRRAA
ncbi:MAG TPA: EAL domain-containing protein [Anaeromyxobacteraceae bacterium]|nr:EAL domain-containing protein [Anaeromyxobacteraceae bacterium]